MLNGKVIGAGFGGTKGCIRAIERGIIKKENAMIVNSTLKDIPMAYDEISACYSRAYGGSAQERSAAKELSLDALQNDDVFIQKIDGFVDPTTEVVVFVVSSEGGTGSGSVPVLAKYFNTVIRRAFPKLKIHIFDITGFEDSGRGMQNTIEFFQELDPSYTVQAISLKKYIDDGMTRSQAEDAADEEFASKLSIVLGRNINYEDSRHNMDESDLLKVTTTPGFMRTWRVPFTKLKNIDAFNTLLSDTIDNDKSLDIPKQSIARLGIITHIDITKHEEMIDYGFPIVKNKLGNYFEIFTHDNKYIDGQEEYVEFIASGLKMPIDELKSIYAKYQKETASIQTSKDDFFDVMNGLRGDIATDKMFTVGANKKNLDIPEKVDLKKDDFFGSFVAKEEPAIKEAVVTEDDNDVFKKDITKNF